MGWWVSSEKIMVTWVSYGTFTQSFGYILWKVRSIMNHWLVSFIWECYGDLSKVRYFHLSFGYILWNVRSTMNHGWWVSYEKVMVTWIRLGTFIQSFGYILWKVRSTMNHGLVSFIWESYGYLSNVRYFHIIFWLHSVEGESTMNHGLLSFIWESYGDLS